MKKYFVFLFIIFFSFCINVSANTYKIKGTYVKMREGATTSSAVLDTFNNGDTLIMLDFNAAKSDDACSMGWAHITYDGKNGYVCKNYVEEIIENNTATDADYAKLLKSAGFPDDYIPYLTYLHQKYGNWEFRAKKTNSSFLDAVTAESACNVNLVPSSDASQYKNNNCKNNYHDWVTASSGVIAYYMDPRNFLNERDIFMFENQYVNENLEDINYIDAVKSLFKGKFIYKEIPDLPTFITNAKVSGVSPIAIASRIKQEMGNGKLTSGKYSGMLYSAISGDYYDRYGLVNGLNLNNYYNFYNYGAADSCSSITQCALIYAYRKEWGGTGDKYKDRQTAITGGASIIKSSYLDDGQFTAYFQKFNVAPDKSSSMYIHQYMTNVRAPYSEANIIYQAYSSLNIINSKFVFYIPVFNDGTMPEVTKLPTSDTDKNYGDIGKEEDVEDTDSTGINVTSAITSAGYTINGSNLSNIGISKEVKTIKSNLESMGLTVSVFDKSGKQINDGLVGTGFKITLVGSTSNTYNLLVYGDASGDGKVNALDLLRIQKYILEGSKLSDAEMKTADVSRDGKINSLDLLKIQKYILEGTEIKQ